MTFYIDQRKSVSDSPVVLRSKTEGRSVLIRLPRGMKFVKGLIFLSSAFLRQSRILEETLLAPDVSLVVSNSRELFSPYSPQINCKGRLCRG